MPVPSPALSPRARLALAAALLARTALAVARYAAAPERFRNFEESYNATVAWMIAHGGMAGEALRLQYRSFCGGCTVVAAAGVLPMAFSDRLWAWKLVPLAWSAATGLLSFAALDRWLGRPAAWAFLLFYAVPPLGALDLSLMAWGNHQETSLFAALALWLVATGRGGWAGLVLGLAVAFARTAAYEALVLLPAAVALVPRRRWLPVLTFAAGLAGILVPTAGGDVGWYRMDDAVGGAPATLLKRAATILAPGPLAERLWLPLRDRMPAGAALLAVLAVAAVWALRDRRARLVALLPLAYAAAYCGTQFPIFLLNAKAPVNNLRYHAPWVYTLTLLAAAGVGAAWAAGNRRRAAAVAGVWVVVNAGALIRVGWTPDSAAFTLGALEIPHFVATATPRVDEAALAGPVADARADGVRRRMRGILLGHAARATGAAPPAGLDAATAAGFGEGRVEPCGTIEAAEAALAGLPAEVGAAARRGAALTRSFCEEVPPLPERAAALAANPVGAAYASELGRALVEGCGGGRRGGDDFAACLTRSAAGLPFAEEAAFGAGRAWSDAGRPPDAADAFVPALGPLGPAFLAGTRDPAAGTHQPPFAREGARPSAGG